jgi:glycolate oxidase
MSHSVAGITNQVGDSMSLSQAYTEMVNLFGSKNVLREPNEIQPYSLNVYSKREQRPAFVIKSESAKQLSQLFSIAKKYKLQINPRGSGFDPAEGSMSNNGVIADLTGLNQILTVDEEKNSITVQSGVNFESLSTVLASKGFSLGLEPIYSPAATIGGFIASHGVGYGSIKHGSILNIVRDLEIILSDGSVVHTGFKDVPSYATGYDLTHLLIGSEGTLAIITEATLNIYPKPETVNDIAFSFSDIEVGTNMLKEVSKHLSTLASVFIMDRSLMETLENNSTTIPSEGFIGAIRLEGAKETVEMEAGITQTICKSPLSPQLGNKIWNSRFLYPLIKTNETPALVDDYFVPTHRNADAYRKLKDIAGTYGLKTSFYSLQKDIDSNLSVFILYINGSSKAGAAREELESFIISLGGKPCSAGLRRTASMKKASLNSLGLLKRIKEVFDKENLLSPEKLGL